MLKNGFLFQVFFPYIQNWLFWGGLGDKKLLSAKNTYDILKKEVG